MKSLVLYLIKIYQKIFSPLLHAMLGQKEVCVYEVSCSEYTKRAVSKYGVIKGAKMGLVRFISCRPQGKKQIYANI